MMKKIFFFSISAILMLTLGFTACSDDDDKGSASTAAGVLDKTTGLRITEAGSAEYSYGDQGRVERIDVGRDYYTFTFHRDTIKYYGYYSSEDEPAFYTVSYNGAGLLASAVGKVKTDEDGGLDGTYNISFSYDGSRHIKQISQNSVENYVDEDGKKTTDRYTTTYTFSWNSDKLTKVVFKDKGVEDGESYEDTETYTFNYEGGYVNKFNQWTLNIWATIGDGDNEDLLSVLACVGILGAGPAELPSSVDIVMEEKNSDGEETTDEENYTFSYSFNDDGSLYSSRGGYGSTYYYEYENTKNKDTDSPKYVQNVANDDYTVVSTKTAKRARGIFGLRHHRLNK